MAKPRAEFYLQADKGLGDALRVREYVKQINGEEGHNFEGLVSNQIRESLPVEYADFRAGLEKFGEDKAFEQCRKDGVFVLKEEPKPENPKAKAKAKAKTMKVEEAKAPEPEEEPKEEKEASKGFFGGKK